MIHGEEDLDIAENMFTEWSAIVGTTEYIVYDKGKYEGFCAAYVAGDYLIQHEIGIGKRLGKIEGVVVLKSSGAPVLADTIVVCFPTHVLRYWSSAFLVNPYTIRNHMLEGLSNREIILNEINRVKTEFIRTPEDTVSALLYRGKIVGCGAGRNVVVSGGLPSLGKRR